MRHRLSNSNSLYNIYSGTFEVLVPSKYLVWPGARRRLTGVNHYLFHEARKPKKITLTSTPRLLPVQPAEPHLLDRDGPRRYDAFGVFGTVLRELEWKTPIFSWRVVPRTPNASYSPRRGEVIITSLLYVFYGESLRKYTGPCVRAVRRWRA
jgi:hypothetical protein